MSKIFTKFAIRNGAAVLILCLLVSALGIYSATLLKQEQMPDVSIPIVAVVTIYPGASPADVLNDVTKPLEDSLSGVAGIKNVNSTSAESMSMIVAQFDYSQDMEKAKAAISEAVAKVALPANTVAPKVSRISFGSMPVLKVAVSNDRVPADQLEQNVRDTVLPGVQGVDGVANVNVSGDAEKAVYITLKPDEMLAHNVSLTSVQQQLQANNLSFPVGTVTMGDLTKPVRVTGTTTDVASIRNLEIPLQPNTSKMLTDAFGGIGKGFAALGTGMAGLGKGMAGLGSAVGGLGQGLYGLGYGLYGTGQGVNGMIYLTNAISSMESSISALQAERAGMLASKAKYEAVLASDPTSSGAQAGLGAVTGQIAMANGQLGGMKMGLLAMKDQLAAVQAKFGSALKPPPALPKATAKKSSGMPRMSSGGLTMKKVSTAVTAIKLSEIADVKVGVGPQESFTRTNGKASVLLEISKAQDANTVDVADKVLAKVKELSAKLPGGTRVTTIYDGSEPVKLSVDGMVREGALGALLAIVVILLFLRNVRATVISVISIPLSLLIAMVFLRQADVTLNVMTLGGLTVAIGRVVDDSIVVIENIFRHLSETTERTEQVIIDATAEVSGAITSSTLTTVAVFVPLGMVSGMVGKIFLPFALTVSLALLASLLVAVTVVPLVASKTLLKAKLPAHEEGRPSRMLDWYESVLRWSLDRKWAVFAGALALMVAAGALMSVVGTGFMPQQKERYVNIDVTFPPGTSVNSVNDSVVRIEDKLAKDRDTRYYQTTVGASTGVSVSGGVKGANTASVFVRLNDGTDVDTKVAAWRRELAPLGPTDAIKVSPGGGITSSSSNQLDLQVTGDDFGQVKSAAAKLTRDLAKIDGLAPASNNLGASKPEILVTVDQAKAAKEALSAAQVAGAVRNLLAYTTATQMTVDNRKMDVKLGIAFDPLTKVSDLGATEILNPLGNGVRLDKVATIRQVEGPVSIYAIDGTQYADIKASILDKNTGKVTSAVKALLAGENLPVGVKVKVAGTAEQMSEAFSQLGIAMLVAVGAVYLVMVIAFGEATAPLAILFSLPLAAIGGIFGLYVVRLPLDMPAMIGALMLIGIVVTNAIVLIDRVQKNRKERGMPMREALVEAGRVRMRPIIMTAIATVTALLPLALGMSEGALISQSLAAMVIGGLTLSTALTLVVVPAAFEMLERIAHPERKPRGGAGATSPGAEADAEPAV